MSKWDLYENIYDRLWVQRVSLQPTRERIIETMRGLRLPVDHVLDMSCGTGQLLDDMKTHLPHLRTLGVEPSRMGRAARRKGHAVMENAISELSLDDRFGCICCTHAFPYYDAPKQAIKTFHSHLEKGGYLLIAHAETRTLYDLMLLPIVKLTTSRAAYPTPKQMRNYLEPEFQVCDIIQVNAWYVPSITLYVARKSGDTSL